MEPIRFNLTAPRTMSTAFTLVELLVVIGIISTLIAMLLPALNQARQAALSVMCMSNQRQVLLAINMYAGEQGGLGPSPAGYQLNYLPTPAPPGGTTPWMAMLSYYGYIGGPYKMNSDALNRASHMPTVEEKNLTRCPAWSSLPNSSNTAYALRTISYTATTAPNATIPLPLLKPFFFVNHYFKRVVMPSEYAILFDSICRLSGAYAGQQYCGLNANALMLIHLRHHHRANVGFADGHVQAMGLQEMMDMESRTQTRQGFGYTQRAFYYVLGQE